jgi:signal transduction histidine kinase
MIRNSLIWKLTLAFLLVAVVATALMAFFIRMTSGDRLIELILDQQRSGLRTALEDYYSENGSWQGIEQRWEQVQNFPRNMPTFSPEEGRLPFQTRGGERDRRSLFGLINAAGRVVISYDPGMPRGALAPPAVINRGEPLEVNGERVGTIVTARLSPRLNPEENLYLQRINNALLFATGGALLAALMFGIILARTLTQPLQELTRAAQNIAQGQLEQQVRVDANDELGQLAAAFNRMSQEVVRVNQQRKQMTADIAHDLRTPLTVIGGYVESMRDGVLQPTPERLALIYTEIERLQNLVGDLKMLSQVDAGELPLHPQWIAPKSLLEHAAAPFQFRASQQQIALTIDASEELPVLWVDEGRMMQVFGNLLSNALRYTPAAGEIRLSAEAEKDTVTLVVQDNGSGIPAEALPYIFDRFQRADQSRHSETGESGLGLSIVKALVQAQRGSVRAESTQGGGTRIIITMPAVRQS